MSYPSSIPWNCSSCQSCSLSKIPKSVWNSIDHTSALIGSVKPYDRHWVGYLNSPWPSDIKNSTVKSIPNLLKYFKSLPNKSILSVTASHQINENEFLIFPDFKKIMVDSELELETIVNNYYSKSDSQNVCDLVGMAYILVCTHSERDLRCGSLGPLIIDAFQEIIKSKGLMDKVFVFGISHVGGHKFAGNCIVYHSNPILSGHWYGRVNPENATQLFESHIIQGQVMKELWRGSGKVFE